MSQSKPQFRTVEITLSAPFDGWTVDAITKWSDAVAALPPR
jgi:hypothetical protein